MNDGDNESTIEDGTDFAWRVHGALDSWTGKVDTKASIALAIESAALGFAISRSADEQAFANLSGLAEVSYTAGLVLLLAAIACALLVVLPRLNRRRLRHDWDNNMIYFGHLRRWSPLQLTSALEQGGPYLDQLARQLVVMAKVAWRKHVWLQASLICLVLGIACLLVASATS